MAGLVLACPGHPRLGFRKKDVDARDKRGHDEFMEAVDCISYTESTV
jgi:hypothetical protein